MSKLLVKEWYASKAFRDQCFPASPCSSISAQSSRVVYCPSTYRPCRLIIEHRHHWNVLQQAELSWLYAMTPLRRLKTKHYFIHFPHSLKNMFKIAMAQYCTIEFIWPQSICKIVLILKKLCLTVSKPSNIYMCMPYCIFQSDMLSNSWAMQ